MWPAKPKELPTPAVNSWFQKKTVSAIAYIFEITEKTLGLPVFSK